MLTASIKCPAIAPGVSQVVSIVVANGHMNIQPGGYIESFLKCQPKRQVPGH